MIIRRGGAVSSGLMKVNPQHLKGKFMSNLCQTPLVYVKISGGPTPPMLTPPGNKALFRDDKKHHCPTS